MSINEKRDVERRAAVGAYDVNKHGEHSKTEREGL